MWRCHFDVPALVAWMVVAVAVPAGLAVATPGAQVLRIPLGLDAYMPVPEDNPIAVEKIALGRRLFFDTALSGDGRTSCSTCHQPERAFTDGRPVSVGAFGRQGVRSVPTLVNRGYGTTQFWDGRKARLEDQVLDPIQDQREMGAALPQILARLRRSDGYRALFAAAFRADPRDAGRRTRDVRAHNPGGRRSGRSISRRRSRGAHPRRAAREPAPSRRAGRRTVRSPADRWLELQPCPASRGRARHRVALG